MLTKLGGFHFVAHHFELQKLHTNSHLYTCDKNLPFFGNCFQVKDVFPFTKKSITSLKGKKANCLTRQFPLSTQELRKRLQLFDGGNEFIIGTTLMNQTRALIVCERD